ncbi:PQQ-binding-like beta-propeller repeat protein [Halobacteria archaeon HArc-gm2]|nr:PQQ-binding-like beta-propeller repeat protein [Halobacteria archaeon HArc-gm2]
MRSQTRALTAVALAVALLASAVVAGLPASAFAQPTGSTQTNETETGAQPSDESWPTYRANNGQTAATTADGPEPYGKHSWHGGLRGIPTGAPTVANGTAYLPVLTERDSYKINGSVVAYDAATGEEQWERTDIGDPSGAPTVVDGTVYVSTTAFLPPNLAYVDRNGDGGLYALDAETGAVEWVRNESVDWPSAPMFHGGELYAIEGPEALDIENRTSANKTVGSESLVALDPETGETTWSVRADRLLGIANGTVFVASDGDLVAYDTETRERLWTADSTGMSSRAGFAVTEGAIYAVADSDDGVRTAAFSTADGSVQWNRTLPNATSVSESVTVGDGGVFLTVDQQANGTAVVRLDGDTGAQAWRFSPPVGELIGGPTVANDSVYVGAMALPESGETREDGPDYSIPAVFAVDVSDGAQEWGHSFAEGPKINTAAQAPSVADGQLYLPFYESGLHAGRLSADLHALEASTNRPGQDNRPSDGVHERANPEPSVEANITFREEVGNDQAFSGFAYNDESAATNATIASYEWDVDGDGTFEHNRSSVEIWLEPCETQTVTLRVTTESGLIDTETRTFKNGN